MAVAAELLAEARRRSGLSQAELARRAGVPRSVLNAYERGRREPGVDALVRVLHASGYDLRLAPRDQAVEDRYLGTVLSDVLGLAESLPTRRRGALGPPVFRRTAG